MIAQTNIIDKKPLNNRERTFCKIMVPSNISATQAYIQAGYSKNGARQNAHNLMTKHYIVDEIVRMRTELAIKYGITRNGQVEKLENLRQRCQLEGDRNAEGQCIVDESKHFGLMVDKTITESTDAQRQLNEAEAAEADRLAKLRLDAEMAAESGVLEVEQDV